MLEDILWPKWRDDKFFFIQYYSQKKAQIVSIHHTTIIRPHPKAWLFTFPPLQLICAPLIWWQLNLQFYKGWIKWKIATMIMYQEKKHYVWIHLNNLFLKAFIWRDNVLVFVLWYHFWLLAIINANIENFVLNHYLTMIVNKTWMMIVNNKKKNNFDLEK
jgi:hypothetical protein